MGIETSHHKERGWAMNEPNWIMEWTEGPRLVALAWIKGLGAVRVADWSG